MADDGLNFQVEGRSGSLLWRSLKEAGVNHHTLRQKKESWADDPRRTYFESVWSRYLGGDWLNLRESCFLSS